MTTALWAALLGIGAAALLVAAGYLLGIKRGTDARDALRTRLQARDAAGRQQLQELTRSLQQHEATQRVLESNMRVYMDRLDDAPADAARLRADLRTMLEPIAERDKDDGALRAAVQELLEPLVAREQLGHDLAHLELGSGQRGELPRLLDDIASRGGFSAVLLSDDDGLPLAASQGAADLERLAGVTSLVMLVADRLSRDDGPAPLAVMVHDASNNQLLSRLFDVGGQSLVLTAVASGTNLTPTALDPALGKIEAVLAPVHTG